QVLVDSIDRGVDSRVVPRGRRVQHPVENQGERKTIFGIGKAYRGDVARMAEGARRATASVPGGCGAVLFGIDYEPQSAVERKIKNSIFESHRMAGGESFDRLTACEVAASLEQRFIEMAQLTNRAAAVPAGAAIRQRLRSVAKVL